jgi:UDP-N-acetylmuramate: L-alanyl-gamma-D-glutamyl-meso-diaminopimelate ligase
MHLHFLGICGTFMGSLALIARQLGHRVTGSDSNVYPPMSTQLEQQGIELWPGYETAHLQPAPDLVVVGNAMSRGNAAVEYMLDQGLRYTSGPQWLSDHLLSQRWVLAVSGTHGKTTTSSMLAWILQDNGLQPGYLIGGVPGNFPTSADAGGGQYFVIEADEYDTAFFDKRSKFVHYRPKTLVINNIEYDHADIFADLAAIQTQFHHLVRTVPQSGCIISPIDDGCVAEVLDMGCWTPRMTLSTSADSGADWSARKLSADGSHFSVLYRQQAVAELQWPMLGDHNVSNALAAIAAAADVGIDVADAVASLCRFKGVKRRLEVLGEVSGVTVYDDFAHHPTAIESTLAGLRQRVGNARIFAVLEPRSNTMKLGVHKATLGASVNDADYAWWYQAEALDWDLADSLDLSSDRQRIFRGIDAIIDALGNEVSSGDHIVIMSNGGFENIHQRLMQALAQQLETSNE